MVEDDADVELPFEEHDYSYRSWNGWSAMLSGAINIRENPSFVILDLGCTRSMGSMNAVEVFARAVKNTSIRLSLHRCNTLVRFANDEVATLR